MKTTSNNTLVHDGFRILLGPLADYVCRELNEEFGKNWWLESVIDRLYNDQKRGLPLSGPYSDLVSSLDIANCLILMNLHWDSVFKKKLGKKYRSWINELLDNRNEHAHAGSAELPDSDASRALDTMALLCEKFDSTPTKKIRELASQINKDATTSTSHPANVSNEAATLEKTTTTLPNRDDNKPTYTYNSGNLPSWRSVIHPHDDVISGQIKNSDFAADLAEVHRNKGASEYVNPVEFFERTYITHGMRELLIQALRRVSSQGGDPVMQLKTSFGGGKTHTMLALYHLLGGKISKEGIPANVQELLAEAELQSLPQAKIAVLDGVDLDPNTSSRPSKLPGCTVNTLWGEMAAQLAIAAGKPALYDLIKKADKQGVAPGKETLIRLLDAAGPCLILMDELLAYGTRVYGQENLPAGNFANFINFIQALTEAAKASKNSLVVAAIPTGKQEGSETPEGKVVLAALEKRFGRVEAVWTPVEPEESFEVVSHRLFRDCADPAAREQIVSAFFRLYENNKSSFPLQASSLDYKERLSKSYPIHPQIFDELYGNWSTLPDEKFQKTRGVLRLMTLIIRELWESDSNPMILPGSIPFGSPKIKGEILKILSNQWSAIIDDEVDGRRSTPGKIDSDPRFNSIQAGRRIARTIFLATAPGMSGGVRGISRKDILLGVMQPDETISVYGDCLNPLREQLQYLYHDDGRYWYDTRPTLKKTATDRANRIKEEFVLEEITERLRKASKDNIAEFTGVHTYTGNSTAVPDGMCARLVILPPTATYNKLSDQAKSAQNLALEILQNRGNQARKYQNTLIFLAADAEPLAELKKAIRYERAWKSIIKDQEGLNLNRTDEKEAESESKKASDYVENQMKETYSRLLIPTSNSDNPQEEVALAQAKLTIDEDIVVRASHYAIDNGSLLTHWPPLFLKKELDNLLWKNSDHIAIKTLWEQLCSYCYLPRLKDQNVLFETIKKGLSSGEYFALAAGFDGKRYLELRLSQAVDTIETSDYDYLVKVPVAQKQLAAKAQEKVATAALAGDNKAYTSTPSSSVHVHDTNLSSTPAAAATPEPPKKKRFFMTAKLDTSRIDTGMNNYINEIIKPLSQGAENVTIELDITATTEAGFENQTVFAVKENCNTLGVKQSGFEDE